MTIAIMRITHLRQADLNLLVVFTALAEERNVTRAASRLLLSQPAVSRALQRLREMFHDDLLIRSPSGYEPTPKGKRLLQELSTMLPRLDRLLSGEDFDPKVEEATFRIAVTDHASHVLCPLICRRVLPTAPKVSIEFVPFGDPTFDAIEKGRIDLMLNADDGYLPPRFASAMIFDDSFSCVATKESKYPRVLTLKQYLAAQHVGVGIWGELQTLPDKRLAGIGETPLPDVGSLFHCRHSVRSRHAIARDRSKPPRGVRIENFGAKDTQATRSPGKIQLSDGLASAYEYRCRPSVASSRDTRDSEGSRPSSSH
jgi:DNA-binding transcriptional LysR family regulator